MGGVFILNGGIYMPAVLGMVVMAGRARLRGRMPSMASMAVVFMVFLALAIFGLHSSGQ